jgi:penicillin-binding protein 1A
MSGIKSKIESIGSRFGRNHVKRNPQLRILDAKGKLLSKFDLTEEKYLLGRANSCDIPIARDFISDVHLSISRDKHVPNGYILQDMSKNGTYQGKGKNKIEGAIHLQNGDEFAIGSPQNEDRITIIFSNPLPLGKQICLYTLYGASGIVALSTLYATVEWNRVNVKNIPSVNSGVQIYDRDLKQSLTPRNLVREVTDKKLDNFSPDLANALIEWEDSNFYWHLGIDPKGIGRAIVSNLFISKDNRGKNSKNAQGVNSKDSQDKSFKDAQDENSKSIQGGSTISQQLARTLFKEYVGGVEEQNLWRKLKEAIVALKLESTYSKDELLRLYLNRVPLGARNGFENTSQLYFEKSAKELNLSEVAMLVAMPQRPSEVNPCIGGGANGESVKQRDIVLKKLLKSGLITPQRHDIETRSVYSPAAKNACVTYAKTTKAPYFDSYVKEEAMELLGKQRFKDGDFAIETGIDLQMQEKAELAFSQAIKSSGAKYNFTRGAIVTLDKDTGLIRAMVGGEDFDKQPYNDATSAQRSPGSTFKLFAYTAAIEKGILPTATYSCDPLIWNRSFPGCNHGSSGNTSLMTGFARSENAIALRVAQDVGLDKVIAIAKKMGIKSSLKEKLKEDPGLVLGQWEVNPLELTGAYSTIASGGVRHQPKAIFRIYDLRGCKDRDNNIANCRKIWDATEEAKDSESVLSPTVANTMTSLMRGVVTDGTGKNANIPGLEVAGKTGTTEMDGSKRNTDLWFVGFAKGKSEVTGVWLGNENNSQTTTGTSAQAAQVWSDYMSAVYR